MFCNKLNFYFVTRATKKKKKRKAGRGGDEKTTERIRTTLAKRERVVMGAPPPAMNGVLERCARDNKKYITVMLWRALCYCKYTLLERREIRATTIDDTRDFDTFLAIIATITNDNRSLYFFFFFPAR